MSESSTLARPYAVAAFRQAKESGQTEAWSTGLSFLATVVADTQMREFVSSPKISKEDLTGVITGLCEGYLNQEGLSFVRILAENHRLGLMPEILRLFEQYRANDEGYIDVEVASAFELDEDEQARLAETLNHYLNKQARLSVSIDRELIGGVHIRAGDRVIDATIRGQIDKLAKSLWN